MEQRDLNVTANRLVVIRKKGTMWASVKLEMCGRKEN